MQTNLLFCFYQWSQDKAKFVISLNQLEGSIVYYFIFLGGEGRYSFSIKERNLCKRRIWVFINDTAIQQDHKTNKRHQIF